MGHLRRDNQYYRAVNRELKRRLKSATEERRNSTGSVTAANAVAAAFADASDKRETQSLSGSSQKPDARTAQVEDLAAQVERLEREKEALSGEHGRVVTHIQSLKQYASRFHNISSAVQRPDEERDHMATSEESRRSPPD